MRLFSDSAAKHFCALPMAQLQPREEIESIVARIGAKHMVEGSGDYEGYRQNLLRDAERLYYLALGAYRRAHNLMLPGNVSWAHVTLYYASWYAAHAIIACFGGWVGKKKFVEVAHDQAGAQALRAGANPGGLGGSHQSFWKTFYVAVRPLKTIVEPEWAPALDPISNNLTWQIDTRNRINYQLDGARRLQAMHAASFNAAQFPSSLAGDIATQYEITRCMIGAAAQFLHEMAVATDEFVSREDALADELWTPMVPDVVVATDVRFVI